MGKASAAAITTSRKIIIAVMLLMMTMGTMANEAHRDFHPHVMKATSGAGITIVVLQEIKTEKNTGVIVVVIIVTEKTRNTTSALVVIRIRIRRRHHRKGATARNERVISIVLVLDPALPIIAEAVTPVVIIARTKRVIAIVPHRHDAVKLIVVGGEKALTILLLVLIVSITIEETIWTADARISFLNT